MQLTKIKSYLFSLLSLALVGGVFLVGVGQVLAVGNAYFPQDTSVSMDNGTMTIVGVSDADSVVATATTVTVTISYGQSFTLTSSDRKQLSVTGNYTSVSCSTTQSKVVVTPSLGDAQATVIITPQSGTCTDSGSAAGSSGGGGGGGTTVAATTPTPTPTTTPKPIPTTTTSTSPKTTVSPTSTPVPTSLPGASLAKLYRKTGDSKVYVVQANGLLKLVKSLEEFNSAGYRWQNVKVVSGKKFGKLKVDLSPSAPVLTTPKPTPASVAVLTHLRIKSGVKYVNIRSANSIKGKIVGKALSGQEFEFGDFKNGWYMIKKDGKDLGWISGGYASKF